MTDTSFADIGSHVWQPVSAYQAIQSTIQAEVNQGLWANQSHPDGWCNILVSPPHGVNNSWTTHTFQNKNDSAQTATVVWPTGWPAPAENINGQLPSHFFSGGARSTGGATPDSQSMLLPVSQTHPSPASQPTYKPAGLCL